MDENGLNNMTGNGDDPRGMNAQEPSGQFSAPQSMPDAPPQYQQPSYQQGAPPDTAQYGQPQYQQPPQQPPVYDDSYNYDQPSPKKKKKEKNKRHGIGGIITAVAVAGILVGCLLMAFVIGPIINGGNNVLPTLPTQEEQQREQQQEAPQLGGDAANISDSANPVVDIAEAMKDRVVGITAYNKQLVSGQEPIEQALNAGTGFVISNDGYILTNNHVVADGNLIKITTSDNEEHVAQVIGRDPASEIAVLKVDGLSLQAAPLGNSDELKVGELSVAIGNVHGDTFNNTVTVGYVSNVSTAISLSNGVTLDVIQTDAAINPGNSGGPLLDSKGNVVGVTVAKKLYAGYDENGNVISSEGVGYAIPINKAINIAQQLIENGSIPRAGIGLSYSMISEVDASLWQTPRGALVASVIAGGPAEKAGLQQNDVITEIDGVDLTTADKMPSFDTKKVGDTVSATIWRDGKEYTVTMTLEDLNELDTASVQSEQQDRNQLFPEMP
ncbi:hypothetical protein CE91St36_21560 [Christensenellaceae bacterium]|nr:hypothetical protein CE91St36_21560 [Christensenellaceae bacterium]BDF62005.1 hypothetical protein CE91St37_21550 [Christensenellaceae bacterium]